MASRWVLVGRILVVGMLVVEGEGGCGTYGPLKWYNDPLNEVFTNIYASPLGYPLGLPFLWGCFPKSALVTPRHGSYQFEFTYSGDDLTSTESELFNVSVSYTKKSSQVTLVSGFHEVGGGDRQQNYFSYGSQSPYNLMNYTEVITSSEGMLGFLPRLGGVSALPSRPKSIGEFSYIYEYTSHTLPSHPSLLTEYLGPKKTMEVTMAYSLNKANLITSQVDSIRGMYNTTVTFSMVYNAANTLMEKLLTKFSGGEETLTFGYDASNRLTSLSQDSSLVYNFNYDDSGNLVFLQNTVSPFNVTFSY